MGAGKDKTDKFASVTEQGGAGRISLSSYLIQRQPGQDGFQQRPGFNVLRLHVARWYSHTGVCYLITGRTGTFHRRWDLCTSPAGGVTVRPCSCGVLGVAGKAAWHRGQPGACTACSPALPLLCRRATGPPLTSLCTCCFLPFYLSVVLETNLCKWRMLRSCV